MINGKITITSVDYEKSFQSLLPKLIQKCGDMENPGLAIRFINKMGTDSLPVVLKIMRYMSDAEKEALLLAIIDSNRIQITEALNKFLADHDFGNAVQIGDISAVKMENEEGFSLVATGVKIDYDALLKTRLVSENIDSYADRAAEKFGIGAGFLKLAGRGVLRAGAKAAPGTIEQKAVDLLSKDGNREKVPAVLNEGLEKNGLYLEMNDFVLMHTADEGTDPNVIDEVRDSKLHLPESVEESLLDAVVAYLKETGE